MSFVSTARQLPSIESSVRQKALCWVVRHQAMLLAELGGMVRDHPELPSLVATLDRDLSGPDMAQRWRALADFLRRTP